MKIIQLATYCGVQLKEEPKMASLNQRYSAQESFAAKLIPIEVLKMRQVSMDFYIGSVLPLEVL
jgi:hypothetical protein